MTAGLTLPEHRSGHPLVFAHRGGMAHARENTLTAFRGAVDQGADGLESDVWLTKEATPVLHHDERIRRGLRWRRIRELTRSELPAHVPCLADLYAACPAPFHLALDVCDSGAAAPVIAMAAGRPEGTSRLWLCHPDPTILSSWRQLDATVALVQSNERWLASGADVQVGARRLADLGVDALNLPSRDCSRATADALHREGLALLAWGVDSAQDARRLAAIGVDGIMGDDVRMLLGALRA